MIRNNFVNINKKLDFIIGSLKNVLKKETQLEKEEKLVEQEEEKEISAIEKLEKLEKEVMRKIDHPLLKLTSKDLFRGAIGAFFGAVTHYTFVYGIKVAEQIDVFRANILLVVSFIIGGVFLYSTGFRKVKDLKIMSFLPLRLIVLYAVSLVMSVIVLYLFHPQFQIFNPSSTEMFWESYKQVSTVTLTAILGACTADLIGRD